MEELLPSQYSDARALLESCGLDEPHGIDVRIGSYDDGKLVATGSLCGKIIQGVAVREDYRGEGLAASLVMKLISIAVKKGMSHILLFTKFSESPVFSSIGFSNIASVEGGAVLMEWGKPDIESYLAKLASLPRGEVNGSIVMNANPFTLGHLYLVEKAASECDFLTVIVLREELSTFPFHVRIDLVRKGVSHLPNVTVIDGSDYVVSSATFPSYFTGEKDKTRYHCALDLEVFCRHIAPALNVTVRYVGTEPKCPVTSAYNIAMKERLPQSSIKVVEIDRLTAGSKVISASTVRYLMEEGKIEEALKLVPPSTACFLRSGLHENY